jgi:hypothetical protein
VTGPAGDNWRMTEYNGKPAFMLRSDLVPLVAGGDPAVDQLLTDLIARKTSTDTTPYAQADIDKAVAAQKTDDAAALLAAVNAQRDADALATKVAEANAVATERKRLRDLLGL